MSLLTGAERTAMVVAVDEVETVEITRQVFASLVRNNPEILSRLSELLAQRQLANDQWTPDTASQTVEQVRFGLLGKLRELFAL
jgi:CRP-like cAMP-binding protein